MDEDNKVWIRVLKDLSLKLITPQIHKNNRPNPWVDLSKVGINKSSSSTREEGSYDLLTPCVVLVKNKKYDRNREDGSCTICATVTKSSTEIGPRFQKLLDDHEIRANSSSSRNDENCVCQDCSRLLDGILRLESRVDLIQGQIKNVILAVKTLVRLGHGGQHKVNSSIDGDIIKEEAVKDEVKPNPRKKNTKRKSAKKLGIRRKLVSKPKKKEVTGVNLDHFQSLRSEGEDEEVHCKPEVEGNEIMNRDPLALDLEVKEEPLDSLDYTNFGEDWINEGDNDLEEEKKSLSVIDLQPGSELLGGKEDEETGGRGMRKSKMKANLTLSKIAAEELDDLEEGRSEDEAGAYKEEDEDLMDSLSDGGHSQVKVTPKKRRFTPTKKRKLGSGGGPLSKGKRTSRAEIAETPLICTPCDLTFPTFSALKIHKSRMHDPHTCSTCGMEFKCRKSWTDHVRAKHEMVRRFPCPHSPCKKSFYKRSARDEHAGVCPRNPNPTWVDFPEDKIRVKKPPTFLCHLCGRAFRHKYTLKYHVLERHGAQEPGARGKEPQFCCTSCPKKFYKSESYKAHLEKHRPLTDRLVCDLCPEAADGVKVMFKTLLERLEHTRRVHEGRVTYPCHLCKKRFVKPHYLRWHIQTTHVAKQTMDQRLICDKCGVTFCGEKTLARHEKYYKEKGLDCTKGVHKRSRVKGTLVGPEPTGGLVYLGQTRLNPQVIQQAVTAMGKNRPGNCCEEKAKADDGGGGGAGEIVPNEEELQKQSLTGGHSTVENSVVGYDIGLNDPIFGNVTQ